MTFWGIVSELKQIWNSATELFSPDCSPSRCTKLHFIKHCWNLGYYFFTFWALSLLLLHKMRAAICQKKRCGRSQGGPRWGYDATLFGCLLAGAIKNKWILPVYMTVLCRGTTTPYRLAWTRISFGQPNLSQFPLSGWVNPPSSHFYICLFSPPLLHFDAPAIPPALQAPRVQLALQTPCSQHTMHNPAPVMPDYIETCIETKKKKEEWLALFSVVSFSLMTINAWSNSIRLFLLSIVCSLLFLVRHFFLHVIMTFMGLLSRTNEEIWLKVGP